MTSGTARTATLETRNLPLPFFEAQALSVPVELRPWVQYIWVNRATNTSKSYRFYRAPEVVSHLAFIGVFKSAAYERRAANLERLARLGGLCRQARVSRPIAPYS
jgi:hypothetical protein